MIGIGISGVQGIGKEELVDAYAAESGFKPMIFGTGELFTNAYTSHLVQDRVDHFRNALCVLESSFRHSDSRFISNMTPVDVMARLYNSLSWMDNIDLQCQHSVESAWKDSVGICNEYLSVIMHIQPLVGCPIQEQLNATGAGLIHTRLVNEADTSMFTIRRSMIRLPERLNVLKGFVHSKVEKGAEHQITAAKPH